MLECGSDSQYHQSVLWIIHEYLVKLEESGSGDLDHLSEIIMRPVCSFIKVHAIYKYMYCNCTCACIITCISIFSLAKS